MLLKTIRQLNATKNRIPILSSVRHKAAYEGEGKTTVKVINQDFELGLMIDAYATYGFKLNNGLTVLGSMAIFPRTVLSWQVRESEDITVESFRLFKLLEPKIDLLVVGLDSRERRAVDAVFRAVQAAGLNAEILPTEHACSTFNFLNAEGRSVAAALIPPTVLSTVTDDDRVHANVHYRDVFNKPLV